MERLTESNKLKEQRKMKKTMKRHSFASCLKSLALLFGIALAFASCANEEIAQNANGKDNDANLTTFSTGDPTTRTSMESNGTFYWESGDKIWVKDDNGAWQQSSNAPTEKTASFEFKVPGKFTKSSTYKVYYPGQNGNKDQVSIAVNQSQTVPNTTAHFGASGDCGMADAAWSNTKNGFAFSLDHKAAYLLFLPRTSNTILHNCYLTKVEVNSDNDITSTYTLNPTTGELTGTGTGKQITISTGGSGAYTNGFPLANNATSAATNGAYVVIKPGTHTLKVRYWVKDVVTGIEGTITKTLASATYDQNKYYSITANLKIREYDGYHYYMWDAQNNYQAGHEWDTATPWQPTVMYGTNSNYPQSGDALNRYYNNRTSASGTPCPAQTTLFNSLPNANEVMWYSMKGKPHWDSEELWITMGHLYRGGMWIMKKDKIASTEHTTLVAMKNAAPDGHDLRIFPGGGSNTSIISGAPSASEIDDYFYLPAIGSYYSGGFKYIGENGSYWTSSGYYFGGSAFTMSFGESFIGGVYGGRHEGLRAQPFSDFGDN